MQGRLRRVFSDHLSVVVEWHAKVLREAKAALLDRDEAAGWRPASARGGGGGDPGGGAGRLDSARALILESRSQADNSLPVLRQSSTSVAAFSDAISSVLTVRLPVLRLCGAMHPGSSATVCLAVDRRCRTPHGVFQGQHMWQYMQTVLPRLDHRQRSCLHDNTGCCTGVLAFETGTDT